jgi:hypothetical protein
LIRTTPAANKMVTAILDKMAARAILADDP